jgi:hypothetical protein
MPLQATSGAASYDAFGGGVPVAVNYIEDVFQTWLYTGNGSTQTITNGIDLSTKGGLVWIKQRDGATARQHVLVDTVRGAGKTLASNLTTAQTTDQSVSAFTTSGFTVTDANPPKASNDSPINYASWTFREQAKFFDVVTYTGNGSNRTIAHNLDSVPGCIIVKRTDTTAAWAIYHRSLTSAAYSVPFSVLTPTSTPTVWNSTAPTSTVFSVGTDATVNASGGTYVAYIYAHDAGGFGLTGTDNVISCGSFTTDGAGAATVNLGYEPQWILMKRTDDYDNWYMIDNMRGWLANTTSNCQLGLYANSSGAEAAGFNGALQLTSTGFKAGINTDSTFIYIAIRRGPMKVPTDATKVFAPALGVSTTPNMVAGFPVDSFLGGDRDTPTSTNWKWWDRLRGNVASLLTTTAAAEATDETNYNQFQSMTGFNSGNYDASDKIGWMFKRAPSFFDEVCYTATISAEQTFNHNLGVTPELIFLKRRDSARNWVCWQYQGTNGLTGTGQFLNLNLTAEANASTTYNDGYVYGVSATQFAVNGFSSFNNVNSSCVAYLFASCAGVSKCFSYTGNGSSQTINCGFTGGARFVLIKRTDSTGDWYVWDTARGIVSGNDPHLSLNTTAAEVTSDDTIDTDSTGFVVNQVSATNVNVSSATYIGLAIA